MTDFPDSVCPLAAADRRLCDGLKLWVETKALYFHPDRFRLSLNNAIQTLRNVTFVLQKTKGSFEDFDGWYGPWQDRMRSDPQMRWLVESRNVIVKQGDLETHSLARVSVVASWFELRRSDTDGYLGINFDLYGSDGKRVGTVRNAQLVPPVPEGYSVRHGADHYVLTEDATGRIICDIKLRQEAQGGAEIEVAAEMYMPDGFLLRFTPEQTNLGGITLRGNIFRNCGAATKIS